MHNKFPKYYYFIDKFDKRDIKKLNENIAVIYRNYKEKTNIKLIKKLKYLFKKKKIKFFLSNNINLSVQLNLDGVYIPSFNNKMSFNFFPKKKNFQIIGSAHNLKEIKTKEKQGAKVIFLSPLFKTNKSKYYLNINRFNLIAKQTNQNIVALGGINQLNYKKLFLLNIHGFASISFFKKIDKFILDRIIIKHKNYLNNFDK